MFNSGFRGKRAGDNQGTVNPQSKFVQTKYPIPTITSWSISGLDDTALSTAGGQTVLVNGTGFASGCAVTLNGATITPVTFVNSTQISFTSPALSGGSYTLVVYNSSGGGAILVPGLTYSSVPTYTTAAGSIGSGYETSSISTSVVATSDSSITYAITSGSLPAGASMTTGGVITGTYPVVASGSSTTYSFDITATDAEMQDVTRSFSLTTNIDVVSWTTPSSGATINLDGTSYSQALSATSAAGKSITYSADTLPTGLTLSAGTISGTPTVEGSTSTVLTATSATTNRTGTNSITWVVSLNDTYFKYTTMLLSANSSIQTQSFVADNSVSNQQLTVVGDTRATNFTPYQQGYYSIQFSATPDYFLLPVATQLAFAGDYTIECWVYLNSVTGTQGVYSSIDNAADSWQGPYIGFSGTSFYATSYIGTTDTIIHQTTVTTGQWYHLAMVRNGSITKSYLNGVQSTSTTTSTYSLTQSGSSIGTAYPGSGPLNGYISNLRIVKGTAVYTASFTPPTSPLLPISGTVLLVGQNNRFQDQSPNNFTLTATGTPKIVGAHPFTSPTTISYGTQYSTYFPSAVTNFLSVPHNANLTITSGSTDSFIAECWVYFNTVTASTAILDKAGQNTVTFQNWSLNLDSSKKFQIIWGGTGSPGSQIGYISGTTVAVAGQWYHLAYVKTNADWGLFVNGTREASYNGLNTASDGTLNPLRIGSDTFSSQSVTGIIADVRIYKGATANAPYLATNTTLTVPTSRLTAITGTQLLTCQDSTFKDNSTNNYTVTGNGLAQPIIATPVTQTYSSSGNITTYGSAYFDGTGDYVTVPGTSLGFSTSDFTIEMWVYFTGNAASVGRQLIDMRPVGTSGLYPTIYVETPSGILYYYTNLTQAITGPTITLNQWIHVAVSRVSSVTKMFVNGVQVGSNYNDTNNYVTPTTVVIGGSSETLGNNPMMGYISDVRIIKGTGLYNSNFTPTFTALTNVTNTKLLTLQTNGSHNNSVFKDQSGFNSIITRNGNTTNGAFSPYGDNWSVYFNGSSSLAITPTSALNLGNTYTYEMWAMIPTGTSNKQLLGGGSTKMLIGTGGSGSTIGVLRFYDGTSVYLGDSAYLIANDRWNHIAVVRESTGTNGFKMYVNGILVYVGTNSSGLATPPAYTIGGYNSSTDLITAYISNLRISNSAIYTTASTTIGTQVFTPSTAPLNANANTLFLACRSNKFEDLAPSNYAFTVTGTPTVQKFSPFSTVTVPKYYSTKFDGSTDQLKYPAGTAFSYGTGDFTIEFWVYLTATPPTYGANIFSQTVSGTNWLILGIQPALTVSFTGYNTSLVTTGTITLNSWYHIAAVRSSGTMKIYFNGTLATGGSGALADDFTTLTYVPTIGGYSHAASNIPTGYLSNVRVIKGQALVSGNFTPSTLPLTSTTPGHTGVNVASSITGTVSALTCQDNTIKDNSTNNFTITATTTTVKPLPISPFTQTASSQTSYSTTTFGGSMYFDGNGDYLTIPGSQLFNLGASTSTPWTVECWVYQLAGKSTNFVSQGAAVWRINADSSGVVSWLFNTSSVQTASTAMQFNAWNHLAFSYDGTYSGTSNKLFVNGVLQAAQGQFIPPNDSSTTLYIGRNVDGGTAWDTNGYIADVRITKGLCLYKSSFYPPTSPLQQSSNSTLLVTGTSGGVIDATRTVDFETVADAKVTPFSPYNGTYYSNYFDGTGDWLTFTGGTPFNFGSGDFTIEAWVNAQSFGNSGLVFFSNFIPNSVRMILYLSPTGVGVDSGSLIAFSGTTTCSVGTWYHCAFVRSGSSLKTFINGTQVSTATYASAYWVTAGTNVTVGDYSDDYSTGYGYVSNLRVIKGQALYTGTFTPATAPLTTAAVGSTGSGAAASITGTVSLLTCQSNKFIDNSTNAAIPTVSGNSAVKTQNPFQVNTGQSYYFDGTGDYLALKEDTGLWYFGTGDFTIEAWVNPAARVSNGAYIIDRSQYGVGSDWLFHITSTGTLQFYMLTGGSNIVTSTGTVPLNAWTHVAVVRSGTNVRLYINGTNDGTLTGFSSALTTSYGPTVVGNSSNNTGSTYFNGYIADLRVTKGYARTISVPTTPLKTN